MDGPAFDELTKVLRSAATRRQAAGGLVGLGLAALTGRALTDAKPKRHAKHKGKGAGQRGASGPGGKGGNSACAKFCAQVFGADTPAAGQCTSEAARGAGLCTLTACQRQGKPDAGKVCCAQQNGVCPDYASAHCCAGHDTCGGGDPSVPGVCGCTPDSDATTCTGTCGTIQNNCGQDVNCTALCAGCCDGATCNAGTDNGACGKNGEGCVSCVAPQTCGGGGHAGTCGCTPNCSGKCGGASDGCGTTCTADCGAGKICVSQTCVTGQGTCNAGDDTCTRAAPFNCDGSGTPRCACYQSIEGDTRCADRDIGLRTGCTSSAECARDYPREPGVFCSQLGFSCGATQCFLPCPR